MRLKNNGFSLVELLIVIGIMAVLLSIIAPMLLGNIEKGRKQKDLSNARTIMDLMKYSYADGSISFKENQGESAVWVFVTRNKAQFYANGSDKFPKINGVSDYRAQNEFKNLLKEYGIDGDSLKVNVTDVKDTGTAGTDKGWNWYCVYIRSDGEVGIASGPGDAGEDYISGWGSFKAKILNWSDKENSAMAREIAY